VDMLSYLSQEIILREFDKIAAEFSHDCENKLNVSLYYKENSYLLLNEIDPSYISNYELMCAQVFKKYNKCSLEILSRNDSLLMLFLNKKNYMNQFINVSNAFQEHCATTLANLVNALNLTMLPITTRSH
jgi:hypothetical protein